MRRQRSAQAETAEAPTKPAAAEAPTKPAAAEAAQQPAEQKSQEKASSPEGGEKTAPKPKPAPNLQERMEGVQGWLAEIERRQRRMTFLATGAALLAVIAAAAAIALSLQTRSDSATQGDVDELRSQVDGVTEQVTESTQGQLKSLNDTVGSFDGRIATLEKQQTQVTADISALRRQVNTAITQANQAATQGADTTGGGGGGAQQP